MKKDIESLDDIKLVVNTFYQRIQKNEVLGPIFEERIAGRWEQHLEKMYRFWQTILFNEHTYSGAPFPPHATMPIDESHFVIWVQNWTGTLDDFYSGPIAEEAKKRGTLMAAIFNSKLEYLNKTGINMNQVKYPFALISTFTWIGFVCAISFMEAWLKFRAPGINLQLGLGIGRIVFAALNKVEWVFAIAIIMNYLTSDRQEFQWSYLLYIIPVLILGFQTAYLLPALDTRAELIIKGSFVESSSLHFVYVCIEAVKVISLIIFGTKLIK